ncbi:MAG: cytochrome c, partial [Chloroflexi bacterium]|nr:cytochrome c [Chloroflexota bacterium]
MRKLFALIPLIIVLASALAACDTLTELAEQRSAAQPAADTAAAAAPVDTALVERGISIYRAQYCGSCHTLDAANTRGIFGPAHDNAAADAAAHLQAPNYSGEAATVEDYLRESIVNPLVFYTPGYEATNHHMPAFGHLPAEDIDAMIYML